jgi:hypothetical protein
MSEFSTTTAHPPLGDDAHNLRHEASTTHHRTVANAVSSAPPVSTPASKFDPQRYRKSQTLVVSDSTTWGPKTQTIIPVRKPSKMQFVHAHPSPDYRADDMPTITDEKTGEIYLLSSDLELPVDIANKVDMLSLATAITAEGSLFLWFYKNTTNSWHESARIAIRQATQRWVRVSSDKSSNGYLLEFPMVDPPAPVWPELTFTQILEKAFGSRFIESLNHPLVQKLRGNYHA